MTPSPCECLPGRPPCRHCLPRMPVEARFPAPASSSEAPGRTLPCLYLGPVIRQGDCPCPARWLRHCDLHRTCSLQDCKTCPDYQEVH
jgi:hypothetical protein